MSMDVLSVDATKIVRVEAEFCRCAKNDTRRGTETRALQRAGQFSGTEISQQNAEKLTSWLVSSITGDGAQVARLSASSEWSWRPLFFCRIWSSASPDWSGVPPRTSEMFQATSKECRFFRCWKRDGWSHFSRASSHFRSVKGTKMGR